MTNRIYLDHAATTPMDQRVFDAMAPFTMGMYGNASSMHTDGTRVHEAMDNARDQLAGALGASASEICFTSGGTEANNWALKGIAFANRHRGNHIIVSSIEHDSVLNVCQWLMKQGFRITFLPVDGEGMVDPLSIEKWISPETILISVMHANNEIGTIQPIGDIARLAHEKGIYFHTDACQSFGKVPINVSKQPIDLLTVNAHKIYGPKGVGALYIRKGVVIEPILHGGGQEMGMRSTTENIPGIIGFAKAAELCLEEMEPERARLNDMRNRLVRLLEEGIEGVYFNGGQEHCLPGYLNFSISGMEGESIRLALLLDEAGISVSTGSACSSNHNGNPSSHVLQAIGRNPFEARGAIRVTMGRFTKTEEIGIFYEKISEINQSLTSIFHR
ncbi:MAG: cysteine desulfurase [Bacteroidales bacterium]|nr:cysteine desulfurase [Bacteroidales bacterium]